jgi:bifunctional UDP-N-acetylglucosamine pyrophosphorylase/glucosamine-1-phosphate N-acetyltransferase
LKIDAIILAAGQGTRMRSKLPKVLHPIAGKPMLAHVISAARALPDSQLQIVIGHGAEQVRALDSAADISFAIQSEQLGTGHAVQQAESGLRDDAVAVVLYGDVPLIQAQTLQQLCAAAADDKLALLTVSLDNPTGYGRIVRDSNNAVQAIVEQKDASAEQLLITEVNTGFMAMPVRLLRRWLPQLSNNNAQQEYYLTDLVAMAVAEGTEVVAQQAQTEQEVQGVNDRMQLASLERCYQQDQATELLKAGLYIADPARIDVRGELQHGQDCSIDVNCVFEGEVTLGDNVSIGPNCVISDATIADGAVIKAHSVIESASVGSEAIVGPFARLRPGASLGGAARVGNFVEIKNTTLGEGSKVNHLAYVGDAQVGDNCNIGAGTITCNYDGANKHKTTMGDNVFIGSNRTLVAPIDMNDGAFVAAGSTVTKTVAGDELAVARAKQRNIQGWQRPTKDA